MKLKTFIWIIVAAVAVIGVAAGVTVLINRYLNTKKDMDYIECECEPDPDVVEEDAE